MDRLELFSHSLDQSILLTQELESVMLEETRAVETHDLDTLQRVIADKQRLVAQLEEETGRQRGWVEAGRHSFTPPGMERFFTEFDDDDRLRSRWSVLHQAISRCDGMNQHNARLIERDRRRVNASLRILSGDDGSSATYDPRGRTSSGGSRGRTISRA